VLELQGVKVARGGRGGELSADPGAPRAGSRGARRGRRTVCTSSCVRLRDRLGARAAAHPCALCQAAHAPTRPHLTPPPSAAAAAATARAPQGTVGELKARSCALFGVAQGDVRIWDYFQHGK
jgi:hypothetical protein